MPEAQEGSLLGLTSAGNVLVQAASSRAPERRGAVDTFGALSSCTSSQSRSSPCTRALPAPGPEQFGDKSQPR